MLPKWKKVGESGNMFFGSYVHVLDEKNRLLIPSKLRGEVGAKLYIIKGYDGALALYCEADFENYLNNLKSQSFASKLSRDVERIALSTVAELEIDKQSRIQIPAQLIAKYSLTKEVVILGVLDHLEIWNKSKWDEYLKENEAGFEEKSEELLKNNG